MGENDTKQKRRSRIIAVILVLFAVGVVAFAVMRSVVDPKRGVVYEPENTLPVDTMFTREQAAEDIDYILDHIESRHPACMEGLPENVIKQGEKEKDAFGKEVSVLEIWQAAARTMAVLKDGHTAVAPVYDDVLRLPLKFRVEKGQLFGKGGEYDGCRVVSIGGIAQEELYKKFLRQSSYELEGFGAVKYVNNIMRKDYLEFLDVDVSEGTEIIWDVSGQEVKETYTFGPKENNSSQEVPFVEYQIDEENGVGIFTLRECNINETYSKVLKEFFTEVKKKGITCIAVDLRNNGGGNSTVTDEFFRYLDVESYAHYGEVDVRLGSWIKKYESSMTENNKVEDLLFDGDLYVLTSPGTFSAATDFAVTVSDNELGYIVGETSGGMPTSYGDLLQFQTPNSKLLFAVSYKYFHRPDTSKDDQPLTPDYPTDADKALEKVDELEQEKR